MQVILQYIHKYTFSTGIANAGNGDPKKRKTGRNAQYSIKQGNPIILNTVLTYFCYICLFWSNIQNVLYIYSQIMIIVFIFIANKKRSDIPDPSGINAQHFVVVIFINFILRPKDEVDEGQRAPVDNS